MLKSEIRKNVLKKREKYSLHEIDCFSYLIKRNLFIYFDFNQIKIVHLFLPIEEKHEINTWDIIDEIYYHYDNIKIIVPVINFEKKELSHKYYFYDTKLIKNKYNIWEPTNSELFTDYSSIDMIIVPLLSFDKRGYRVGYGGGYYDKFLKNCSNAKKIGLSFDEPIDKIADINEYDIKLDYCITPAKVHDTKKIV